jgi:hypothetical protein
VQGPSLLLKLVGIKRGFWGWGTEKMGAGEVIIWEILMIRRD